MESILKYKLNTLYPAEFIHYTAEMRDAKQVPGSETCSAYTPPTIESCLQQSSSPAI